MRALVLAAVTCFALAVAARTACATSLDEDFQIWTPVILQVDLIPKRLKAYAEVQPRFDADAGRLGTILWRPALGVVLQEWVSLWGGYAYVERYNPTYAGEHRIWEQVQVGGALDADKRIKLAGRLRMEHRIREGVDPFAHRLRIQVRGQVSLMDPAPPSVYVAAWDELFLQLNTVDWGPQSGFDRNRAFLGLGVQIMEQVRIEGGYLLEVIRRRGPAEEIGNHILAITLWLDL